LRWTAQCASSFANQPGQTCDVVGGTCWPRGLDVEADRREDSRHLEGADRPGVKAAT
jgi:hypothetical protein